MSKETDKAQRRVAELEKAAAEAHVEVETASAALAATEQALKVVEDEDEALKLLARRTAQANKLRTLHNQAGAAGSELAEARASLVEAQRAEVRQVVADARVDAITAAWAAHAAVARLLEADNQARALDAAPSRPAAPPNGDYTTLRDALAAGLVKLGAASMRAGPGVVGGVELVRLDQPAEKRTNGIVAAASSLAAAVLGG